ncbi:MAG TPA: TMEM175 family protein [Candidatus Dormibacteraeota bacterium]|nr:TMEM175 family protein [Candidatus Dormibacteraeota bacterium]
MNKARFEAFSDGVFAFAITLLALGFVLPEMRAPSNHELATALLRLWPNLIAYALSFSVIGLMWQNHHALFRLVRTVDRQTVFWNLQLLAGTVLIPFATTTLGAYPTRPPSTFLYGVVLSACATFFNLMLWHLVRSDAFEPEVSRDAIATTVKGYRIGQMVYIGATLIALVLPLVSFGAYLALVVYFLIPRGADSDTPISARRW